MLEALVTEPFEPLELSSLKALSWKTALLLALTLAKRVSELTALSVHPSCLLIRGDQSESLLCAQEPKECVQVEGYSVRGF